MSEIWHYVSAIGPHLIGTWHYIRAPHLLLSNTYHDIAANRAERYLAWIVDLTLLSLLLPLLVGLGARVFRVFKPDPDDAKAIAAGEYPQKHAELRARPLQQTFVLGTQLNFVRSERPANPLVLPSPEPDQENSTIA